MEAESDHAFEAVERTLAEAMAGAGIRLRYDKVALRLITGVRAGLRSRPLDTRLVIFTIAAPIRQPAKTTAALIERLPDLPSGGLRMTVHGNAVQARPLRRTSTDAPRVLGLVHNPNHDAGLILDLAEACIRDD